MALAALATAGLVVSGCGLEDLVPDSDARNEEASPGDAAGGDPDDGELSEGDLVDGDDAEPEGFDEGLPRFGPGETVEGSASDDPWEGVLVVEESTFVTVDVRNAQRTGGRELEITDAAGEQVAHADNRGDVITIGGSVGDPVVMVELEAGEYLVSAPVHAGQADRVAEDITVHAFEPPVVQVGDRVEVNIRSRDDQNEGLAEGELFGIEIPSDGAYTFEIVEQEIDAYVFVYRGQDQRLMSDFRSTGTRGLVQDEFEAGPHTIMVYTPSRGDGPGSAVLEIREG